MLTADTPQTGLRVTTEEFQHSSAIGYFRSALWLVLAAGFALSLAACKEEPQAENHVRPVKAIVVALETGDVVRTFSGIVRARVESNLGFRVPGKILVRRVNPGDTVAAGEMIARLDDTDLRLAEDAARAAVASAKTRLAVAKDALGRAQVLLPKGYTPKAVLDQRQLEFDAAQSALEAAESQARQAANATQYAVLKADKGGIVSAVHAEAGQVVAAGTPVITLAEAGETEVALAVPEQDVARLRPGTPVKLTLWADGAASLAGTIREIAGQADPALRTYAVRVSVSSPPAAMRLGMTATATLHLGKQAPHMTVPVTALTQVEGRDAVYVAARDTSTVTPRFVTTGGVSGLQPGEIVVTGGVQFLARGKKVRLPDEVMRTADAQ
jgi:multidrug efflux system membrane fusion protein